MSERPKLEFWYDLASTYSYLSAMRIEALAETAGVDIVWRPFLLGPIFHAQGWATSPFNVYPAKGRYMVRDMARLAEQRGLPFRMPESFPQSSVRAARVALVCESLGFVAAFTKAAFMAEFSTPIDLGVAADLHGLLAQLGLPPEEIMNRAEAVEIKELLRKRTAEAADRGIFGAPTFVAGDEELFWGDDRLEQAIAWAHC